MAYLVGIGDGPDLKVEVELRAKGLPLLGQHAEKAAADRTTSNQAHADRLLDKIHSDYMRTSYSCGTGKAKHIRSTDSCYG